MKLSMSPLPRNPNSVLGQVIGINSFGLYSDIEHIWQTAWRLGFYRGGAVFMSAISGIDIALWDLKGTFL